MIVYKTVDNCDLDLVLKEKIEKLIKEKEETLKVQTIEKVIDNQGDLHVLCKKEYDGSYAVWSAYYTGEEKTSFENFYNGSYSKYLKFAVDELTRRVERNK